MTEKTKRVAVLDDNGVLRGFARLPAAAELEPHHYEVPDECDLPPAPDGPGFFRLTEIGRRPDGTAKRAFLPIKPPAEAVEENLSGAEGPPLPALARAVLGLETGKGVTAADRAAIAAYLKTFDARPAMIPTQRAEG